jgi:hypothetical protein
MGLAPAGKLTFEGIPRAMEYRVEWSEAPGRGEWQREGLGITEVLAAGCCVGRRAKGTKGPKGPKGPKGRKWGCWRTIAGGAFRVASW